MLIEEAWERYNRELQVGNSPNPRVKVGKFEVSNNLEMKAGFPRAPLAYIEPV